MPYWDLSNPLKPWGLFDTDATLDIPFDWTAWLAEIGETIAGHQIIVSDPLELVNSSVTGAGIVVAFVRIRAGQTPSLKQKYPVTCRITTTGATPRKDDRTVYLKMEDR